MDEQKPSREELSTHLCEFCKFYELDESEGQHSRFRRRCNKYPNKTLEFYGSCADFEEAPDNGDRAGDWRDEVDDFEKAASLFAKRVGWVRHPRSYGVLIIFVDPWEGDAKLGYRQFVRVDIDMIYKEMFGEVDFIMYRISSNDMPVHSIRGMKAALRLLADILEEKGDMDLIQEPPPRILELD